MKCFQKEFAYYGVTVSYRHKMFVISISGLNPNHRFLNLFTNIIVLNITYCINIAKYYSDID
jgi:hypothetical protein